MEKQFILANIISKQITLFKTHLIQLELIIFRVDLIIAK